MIISWHCCCYPLLQVNELHHSPTMKTPEEALSGLLKQKRKKKKEWLFILSVISKNPFKMVCSSSLLSHVCTYLGFWKLSYMIATVYSWKDYCKFMEIDINSDRTTKGVKLRVSCQGWVWNWLVLQPKYFWWYYYWIKIIVMHA